MGCVGVSIKQPAPVDVWHSVEPHNMKKRPVKCNQTIHSSKIDLYKTIFNSWRQKKPLVFCCGKEMTHYFHTGFVFAIFEYTTNRLVFALEYRTCINIHCAIEVSFRCLYKETFHRRIFESWRQNVSSKSYLKMSLQCKKVPQIDFEKEPFCFLCESPFNM